MAILNELFIANGQEFVKKVLHGFVNSYAPKSQLKLTVLLAILAQIIIIHSIHGMNLYIPLCVKYKIPEKS